MKQLEHAGSAAATRVAMRRIAGLDGLRAVAAGLVLIYHLVPGWAGLGYIGVDIFFVLSGFLITSLLIVSAVNHGSPRLGDFWARRFRRLFPAVFVATTGSAALAFFVGGDALVALGRQVIGSLTATYNWVEIANGSSYFEQASPLLLTNMWSLAVEQQFYLFWPLIVLVLVRFAKYWRIAAALALAGASIALHIAVLGEDVTRAYMGTDTHLWGLMFGAILAFAMQRTVIGPDEPVASRGSALWGTAGWAALAGVIAAGLAVPDSAAMYPWGMVAASLLALLVIRTVLPDVQSASADALRAMLGSRLLSWLGVRSYGIYLWHWPLFVLLYYELPMLNTFAAALIVLVFSIVLAHLSYRYVEDPIRRMGVKPWARYMSLRITRLSAPAAITIVAVPLVVLGCAGAGIVSAPAMSSGQQAVVEGQGDESRDPGKGTTPTSTEDRDEPTLNDTEKADKGEETAPTDNPADVEPSADPSADPTGEPDPSQDPTRQPGQDKKPEPTAVAESPASWDEVTIIGDSVVLAAKFRIDETMPGAVVDAEESRSVKVAPELIAKHSSQGTLGDYVVVSLATNGAISDADVDAIMNAVGPSRTVIFVTAFGPARASWIPGSNDAIESAAGRYPGRAYIADWHGAIKDHTDLLAGDVIHPGRDGAGVYVETIRQTLDPEGTLSP